MPAMPATRGADSGEARGRRTAAAAPTMVGRSGAGLA